MKARWTGRNRGQGQAEEGETGSGLWAERRPCPVVPSPIKRIMPVILVQHLPPHPPVGAMSCSVLNPRANQNTCWETEVGWGWRGAGGSWERHGKEPTAERGTVRH